MKRTIVQGINKLLAGAGCELIRRTEALHPGNAYMPDEALRAALRKELAEHAAAGLAGALPDQRIDPADLRAAVDAFFDCWARRPEGRNVGGSGFSNFFWVYLFVRTIRPALFVESGIWKGRTSWFIEQAAPEAELHGFDLDLGYVDRSAYRRFQFHEQDWSAHEFGPAPAQPAAAFFDCHVNHARRILEASERGFRLLLFDDDLPLHRLYIDGAPGVPTAHMLAHLEEPPASPVTSVWRNETITSRIDPDEFKRARARIRKHTPLPGVGHLTGYGGDSHLSLVVLEA